MRLSKLFPVLALTGLTGSAHAQITLSGAVFDGSGGPLLAGTVYHAGTTLSVPAGQTLTVQEGAILKFKTGAAWQLVVDGTLAVQGSAALPVTFTSIPDDSAGGDTGADGPSAGASGDWAGIRVNAAGLLDADHLEVRFAGFGGWSAVWVQGGSLDLRDSTFRDSANSGFNFNQTDAAFASIEGCAVLGCEDFAMDGVPIDSLPGIKNNSASGNGVDAVRLPGTTGLVVETDVTIGPEHCLNGALLVQGALNQDPGTELVLKAGTVIKMLPASATRWSLLGTLRLEGTAAEPVVLTSGDDDDHGGDTFGDGPTSGAPGDWAGIRVNAGAALEADHAVLRHGGKSESLAVPIVWAQGGSITLRDTTVRDCLRSGLEAAGSLAPITVQNCDFVDNERWPVVDLRWESLAGFDGNTASGNGLGDYIRMSAQQVEGDAAVEARNQINGVIVFETQLNVAPGARLILHKGVVLKTENDLVRVQGALDVLGTPFEPVVFTTLTDDAVAGDTNGDGPSAGVPGEWPGVRYDPEAAASTMEHAVVRYSGASNAGVWSRTPLLTLRSVRVEHGSRDGFELDDAAAAENLVAWDNSLLGIKLDGGGFDLIHATAAGNGQAGIDHGGFYTGVIRNSISWGNGGAGNYAGVSAGDLVFSNGDPALAGPSGNLHVDPLFVDEIGGDLRLGAGSPCVDAADTAAALPLVFDHDQHSRALPSGPGLALADMGAHERAHWTLTVAGSAAAGEILTLGTAGAPGAAIFGLGLLDGELFFPPFGYLTCGVQPLFVIHVAAVGDTFDVTVPEAEPWYGVEFGLQAFAMSSVTPGFAHFTNLYRCRFQPPLL